MRPKTQIVLILALAFSAFFASKAKAVNFEWEHENTEHTEKYVLYKIVGEQDSAIEGKLPDNADDIPVGETPVGSLTMKNVSIEPGASYYLRAENYFYVSGPSNTVDIVGIPAGITNLKLTINIQIDTQ